jgi:hypothetical protein
MDVFPCVQKQKTKQQNKCIEAACKTFDLLMYPVVSLWDFYVSGFETVTSPVTIIDDRIWTIHNGDAR